MAAPAGSPPRASSGVQSRSWALVLGFAALAALRGCDGGSSTDTPKPGGAARGALLASVGPNVVLPTLDAFGVALDDLDGAVIGWREAEDVGAPGETRAAAQAAFSTAMEAWEEAELLQFGPAGSSLSVLGGEDLRDAIDSWPTTLPCRLDQEIVAARYGEDGFVDAQLPNARGLDALEYLLFRQDDGNDCDPLVDINDGPWDALSLAELDARRAAYAEVLVADVVAASDRLAERWATDGGDFSSELATAGEGSATYPSDQDGLDALFSALFYLELVVQNRKLARPLGLRGCFDVTCPEDLELRWSRRGGAAIGANLRGFRRLFTGGDGAGFDDLLEAVDQGALVAQILAGIDAAEAQLTLVGDDLGAALSDDPDAVLALHDAVGALVELLRGDFALYLTLQVPTEAAGDGD